MGYTHCDRHDEDATNGCGSCDRERINALSDDAFLRELAREGGLDDWQRRRLLAISSVLILAREGSGGPDVAYTGRYGVPFTREQWECVGELLRAGLHGSSLDEIMAGLLGAAIRQAVGEGWCGHEREKQ